MGDVEWPGWSFLNAYDSFLANVRKCYEVTILGQRQGNVAAHVFVVQYYKPLDSETTEW